MENNCFLLFNSNINVDVIKIDMDTKTTFQDAITNKDEMLSTTVLFNSYVDNINASYFSPTDPVSGANIAIYKKTPFQKYYNFITLLTNGQYEFYDYNIVNNEYYHYLASIEIQTNNDPEYLVYQNLNEDGSLVYLNTKWDKWSLVNLQELDDGEYITQGDIWTFRANIDSEEITQNTNVTTWDTLGQFPKMSIGQKNYNSSNFTALLGDIQYYSLFDKQGQVINDNYYGYTEKINVNSKYGTNKEKLKLWEQFVTDGEIKLLKDQKGNAWIVQILANPSKNIDLKNSLYPVTISFQWQEIAKIDGASIVGGK